MEVVMALDIVFSEQDVVDFHSLQSRRNIASVIYDLAESYSPLTCPSILEQNNGAAIPNIIHRIWFEFSESKKGLHKDYIEFDQTVRELHPNYCFINWDATGASEFVSRLYPEYIELYQSLISIFACSLFVSSM